MAFSEIDSGVKTPRSVTQGCGQKMIPVYKVMVGDWIRAQNPDLLRMVAVKN